LGNITNPVINRIGKSIFWSNYDVNKKMQNTWRILIVKEFIGLIIRYSSSYSIFTKNTIWWVNFKLSNSYKNNLKFNLFNIRVLKKIQNSAPVTFFKRKVVKMLYPYKMWLLIYNKYLIIFWYFFKPLLKQVDNLKNFSVHSFKKGRRAKYTALINLPTNVYNF